MDFPRDPRVKAGKAKGEGKTELKRIRRRRGRERTLPAVSEDDDFEKSSLASSHGEGRSFLQKGRKKCRKKNTREKKQ
jgi:hypothetical protein